MSFSKAQQPAFRVMVAAAWATHCRLEGIAPVPAKPERGWYEQELAQATGKSSTKECNAGRDYDRVMAHFEVIVGTAITWQMRVHSGDAARILHELRKVVEAHDIEEDYLRGVARRMLRMEKLPELEKLTREQLILILGEVKRYCRRRLKTGATAAAEPVLVGAEVEEPF